MKTNLTKTNFSLNTEKKWYYTLGVIVVAFVVALLLMIPEVAQGVAGMVTDTKEKAGKLADKIMTTASTFAYIISGALLIALSSIFVGVIAPVLLVAGVIIVGLGIFFLTKNWGLGGDNGIEGNTGDLIESD